MPEEEKPDKLGKVREAGQMIRTALAENMKARISDVVEESVLAETECVLAAVLKLYLEQIIPDVEVVGSVRVRPSLDNPETIEFRLRVQGELVVSIAPGAEDDALPDPEPAVEETPLKT